MALGTSKSRLFEDREIPTGGADVLRASLMLPRPPNAPKRLAFVAPLVGAGASQALILFRNLTRRGTVLVSFEYRGHARSGGTFDLDKTIADVHSALKWASEYAARRGLPLHAFATCYGAVPLAAQFANGREGWPLRSFSTVSGLFRLDQILRFEDFAVIFSGCLGRRLDAAALLAGLARREIDCDGEPFRQALQEYLAGLFPQLSVGANHFEELQYDRADIPNTLLQLSRACYLDGLALPPEIPCHCFFGRSDDLMGLHTQQGREAYRSRVLSLIPHAEFHECEVDHFGRGPDHERVIETLGDLFEKCDTRPCARTRRVHRRDSGHRRESGHLLGRPLVRFWNEQYGVAESLEADSWIKRLLNKYVVAAFMNTFPRAATSIFSRSKGELARLLYAEKEGGSFRVLRAMYRFDQAHPRGDWANRLLMQSPAVKAARNRRRIAQRMLQIALRSLPPDRPALVLAIGGGDGSLEAEALAQAAKQDVFYCGVDRDPRAVCESREVLRRYGLEGRGLTITGTVAGRGDVEEALERARREFGVPFEDVSISVCQGIAEYLDIGSETNESLATLLRAIHACTRREGSLIISQTDYHDRVAYLEKGLSWHMRLRSPDELEAEIEKAGWRISVCEQEPMNLITMCLAAKSDGANRRLDRESGLAAPRAAGEFSPFPRR
jgi:hypothetical protein